MAVKKNTTKAKKICTDCGSEKAVSTGFYISRSKLHRESGRLPICKECFNNRYEELKESYLGDEAKAFYHLCMNMDIYFNKDLMYTSLAEGDVVKRYMKNINSFPNWKGKIGTDSEHIALDENCAKEFNDENEDDIYEEREMTPELKRLCLKRWGTGYSDEDYIYLEDNYAEFYEAYAHDTPAERMLLMNISKTLLEGEKSRRSGDKKGYENMLKLVSSMLTDAAIKPSQKKSMGDEVGECFGVFIENLEKNEPINEAIDEFEDVDNIGRLIDRQFVKNFARIFGLVGDDDENED